MSDPISHLPPHSIEAEEALLGAMLMSTKAIERAAEIGVTRSMFYRDSHQVLFDALITQAAKSDAVDGVTTVEYLKARRQLKAAGGAAAVLTLAENVPAVANAAAYAKEVREQAILRSLVIRGQQISALGYEHPDDPEALIAKAGQIIDEMTNRAGSANDAGITTAADELMPFVYSLQDRYDQGGQLAGLPTGLSAFDERLGGLKPGELTIVAGRPAMGKSALAAGIAEQLVFGSAVDVYSVNLEMREQQQIGRMLARAGHLNLKSVRGLPTERDVEKAAEGAQFLYEAASRLHMDQASDLTIAQIRQRARRLNRDLKKQGRALKLIVVDYLQLITPPPGERNETAALTLISRGLKSMALELGVHVIALSQLNRSVEDRNPPRPRLSDLRGSGSIEQDADTVVFVFRPEYYIDGDVPFELQGKAELIAAKMREGEPGTDFLQWEGGRVRFSDAPPVRRPGMSAGVVG